ncbi:MAG: PilZ domain-containing protein [Candidatus Omnitrophota bacterium]
MKSGDFKERRKFKRLQISVPAKIRYGSASGKEKVLEGVTLDVSFNGAYLVNINIDKINPEDNVNMSLSVPRDNSRDFPFSRIVGKARVVRVEKNALALEFNKDVSRFFIAN